MTEQAAKADNIRKFNAVFNAEAEYYLTEENSAPVEIPALVLPLSLMVKTVHNVLSEESRECVRTPIKEVEHKVFAAVENALHSPGQNQRLTLTRDSLLTFHYRMSEQALEAALRVHRLSADIVVGRPLKRTEGRFALVVAIAEQEKLQKLSNMLAKLLTYNEPYLTISCEAIEQVD